MEAEYNAIIQHETWNLVERPGGINVLPVHWLLTKKCNSEGKVVRYKARLVAGGNWQKPGLDFEETYAPVANQQVLRTLLSIGVYLGYCAFHMDVDNAFLNGILEEEVYVRQPKHFVSQSNPQAVCHLKKAIYGLRQLARCWWLSVDATLSLMGFNRVDYIDGIYSGRVNDNRAYILLYVDDILVVCKDEVDYKEIRARIARHYRIKDLGMANQFLNIKFAWLSNQNGLVMI